MKKHKIGKLHAASVHAASVLFVLWQVLKPPIRKAIFKRFLRQRF